MAKAKATMKVSQRFNLAEMFGGKFPDDHRLRLKIGNEIIAEIQRNTRAGKDKDGKPFKKYSKDYKKSLAFKAFGKTGSVNMELSGDMVDTMEIVDESRNTVTVSWEDEQQKLKAENHIHGVTLPQRDFLGLPQALIDKIVAKNQALVDRAREDELTDKDEDRLERELTAEEQ
jgi:hypothetical protein